MYNIQKTDYGVKLTFSGNINLDEMNKWVNDSKQIIKGLSTEFGVFVDLRELKPLAGDVQTSMQEGQILFKKAGMQRSVVILANAILTMQFKRIAKETGIYNWERYIDASKFDNWESTGIDWLKNNIDPDIN